MNETVKHVTDKVYVLSDIQRLLKDYSKLFNTKKLHKLPLEELRRIREDLENLDMGCT